jgi:Outer membrane lipoprotein-sorting protein
MLLFYRSPPMRVIRILVVQIDMIVLSRLVKLSRSCKLALCPEARSARFAVPAIQAVIAILALWSLVHPSCVLAANSDLETVLKGSRDRIEKLDYRATGRLTKVDGDGKRTTYKFLGKARWFPDGLRVLCEISGPGAEKTTILLHMTASGHLTIEARLPGEKAAKALPFERWNDSLVGTDFSYEDMVENQFFWKNQQLLAPEKYGARDCFVLKSTSGAQDRSYYESITSWIDRSILFPVRVVKTVRGNAGQKEFLSYALRQVAGAWSASQVEVKVVGKPGSSMLAIEGGSGKANLSLKDFDIGQSGAAESK